MTNEHSPVCTKTFKATNGMKQQSDPLKPNKQISEFLEKQGYSLDSILSISEDSAVARAHNSHQGDVAVKFVVDKDVGCHEAAILLKLKEEPHIIQFLDHFEAKESTYRYAFVFKFYSKDAPYLSSLLKMTLETL